MSDSVGSLCTGYGGLDGAAEAVFGGELVWVADNDPHVSRLLAERFPDVPNLGDITTQPDAEPVDIVTAGFPCQPISGAGKGLGIDDERWLWPDILTFIGRMDPPPRLLLLENVPRLLSVNDGDAMAQVVEGLASLGYVGRYRLLRASDVGACHRRDRWFCIAHSNGSGGWENTRAAHGDERADGAEYDLVAVGAGASRLPTPRTSDTNGPGHHGTGGLDLRTAVATLPTPRTTRGGSATETIALVDACWGDYAEAIAQHEHTVNRIAPAPTTEGKLNPAFVEWMMMLPEGWVTDLDLPRTAKLRILGNGVVPAQAAAAFEGLVSDVG